MIGLIVLAGVGAIAFLIFLKKPLKEKKIQAGPFPEEWRRILREHVEFYRELEDNRKEEFENRIHLFLSTKKIEAIDTMIDDTIRVLIAASAVIPMFAFPGYNYPNLREVLVYPNSFDEKFHTEHSEGQDRNIIGMVGNRFMNGSMILSRPDLLRAYEGAKHKSNVGIHEFVHLIDKQDGATDGIPEILLKHAYVAPWLNLIRDEMSRIEHGKSDISPYALTSNAEFLAVVSEYFFDNPEKFKRKHPELYHYLSAIFRQGE